jgi:hypothetical protein
MDAREFAALEARLRERRRLGAELDACLAEIRALQKRRCQLEKQLRQLHREAQARQRQGIVQDAAA